MIELKGLTKSYSDTLILDNLSYTFPSTGLVCLLGPSGCGKTTLLNLIAGFDTQYNGDINVLGKKLSDFNSDELSDYRRDNIGFVFQDYHLLSGYTVLENILLSSKMNQNSDIKNHNDIENLLLKTDIWDKANQKAENLSGGQKQRVAIVRALINNPNIILSDEPTGALDRRNSAEIMKLLKDISVDRLVIVITHDNKICEYADRVIKIQQGKITEEHIKEINFNQESRQFCKFPSKKASFKEMAKKNLSVHLKKYIVISFAIAIGVFFFLISLSYQNTINKGILDFKQKNTAFANGYIPLQKQEKDLDYKDIFNFLYESDVVSDVYYQYIIKNVILTYNDVSETINQKLPMAKTNEILSYGSMPKNSNNEISLSPSLASKFSKDLQQLIGKEITIKAQNKKYTLTISGIFNAGYDDFYLSSDIEKQLYEKMNNDIPYSISYDVKNFDDVLAIDNDLKYMKIKCENASNQISNLLNTFKNIKKLFLIISILIGIISIFISTIILFKIQNSRYKEFGLLCAIGYRKDDIRKMVTYENILLSFMAATINAILIIIIYIASKAMNLALIINSLEVLFSIIGTGIIIILLSIIASNKLINTEPALALRL